MKIFVTGGSGFVGWNMVNALKHSNSVFYTYLNNMQDAEGTRHQKLDIENRNEVMTAINNESPDIVIHTAALTSVDLCETEIKLANKINVEGTRNIVDACIRAGSKIIFISTSHVFSGGKIYTEEDAPDPANNYAATKVEGENVVKSSGIPHLILRIDQPYGWKESWQKDNSVTRLLERVKKGRKVGEISDWYNTPTFIDDISDATEILIKNGSEGTYNVVGPDFLNRYQWALKAADVFGFSRSIVEPVNSKYLGLPAKRTEIHASNKKLEKDTGLKMKGVVEGMEFMKAND